MKKTIKKITNKKIFTSYFWKYWNCGYISNLNKNNLNQYYFEVQFDIEKDKQLKESIIYLNSLCDNLEIRYSQYNRNNILVIFKNN